MTAPPPPQSEPTRSEGLGGKRPKTKTGTGGKHPIKCAQCEQETKENHLTSDSNGLSTTYTQTRRKKKKKIQPVSTCLIYYHHNRIYTSMKIWFHTQLIRSISQENLRYIKICNFYHNFTQNIQIRSNYQYIDTDTSLLVRCI